MSNRRKVGSIVCAVAVLAGQADAIAERAGAGLDVAQIRQIILSRGADPAAPAQLVQLTRALEPAVAAELFHQLADDYLERGQLKLAADVLSQLLDQYPEQAAATSGLLNLVRLYASGEIARTQQAKPASGSGEPTSIYALHVAQQAIQRRPEWSNNPALAFQCAVAARRAGRDKAALGWLTPLKHNPRTGPWHDCALVENWINGARQELPPKQVVACSRASERPRLDGVLDDTAWRAAVPLVLSRGQTEVCLARDEEFLYLAIRCEKAAEVMYPTDTRPRTYDAELAEHDHVRLLLDLDRDYATWFAMSIDHRGWTADACWRDKSWNPQWFVASGGGDDTWTIEAAIPWAELCHQPPSPRAAWALAIERRVSGQSAEAWIGPPSAEVGPENFGLLIFE